MVVLLDLPHPPCLSISSSFQSFSISLWLYLQFLSYPSNWNFHLRRNLTDPEIQEFVVFSDILHQVQPPSSSSNSRIWTLSPSGSFSVSSSFVPSLLALSPSFPCKIIWFPLSPSKVQGFLWKLAWSLAPTLDIFSHPTLTSFSYPTHVHFVFLRRKLMTIFSCTAFLAVSCGLSVQSFESLLGDV